MTKRISTLHLSAERLKCVKSHFQMVTHHKQNAGVFYKIKFVTTPTPENAEIKWGMSAQNTVRNRTCVRV